MKLCFVSDTHNYHKDLKLPTADILVHCGDLTLNGTIKEFMHSLQWFQEMKENYKHIIVVLGNHDFLGQQNPSLVKALFQERGVILLNDSGIDIDGYYFWGSPYTPTFMDWAFMENRGDKIARHWEMIPKNTDVLITHGPPHGILDRNENNESCGCWDLGEKIKDIRPVIHAFGHIHEGYGVFENINTKFINASVCSILDGKYELTNDPIVMELNRNEEIQDCNSVRQSKPKNKRTRKKHGEV